MYTFPSLATTLNSSLVNKLLNAQRSKTRLCSIICAPGRRRPLYTREINMAVLLLHLCDGQPLIGTVWVTRKFIIIIVMIMMAGCMSCI